MSIYRSLAVASALLATSACQYNNADLNYDELHKYCSQEWKPDLGTVPPDLAMPPPAKCAAAKGLTGDALICIDFSSLGNQILTTPAPTALMGWDFEQAAKGCWEIASGKLQVKNFGAFVGTCSFTMPLTDLAAAANQKYQSVTLAVVQRVEINTVPIANKNQTAQVFVGLAMPTLQLSSYTGSNPRQQTTHAVTRTDLVTLRGDAAFQPLFQLASAAAFLSQGWQIESIAVMGNP